MKKFFIALATTFLLSSLLLADALGVKAGVAYWQPSPTGIVKDGSSNIDVENDLGFDSDSAYFGWVSFEHFVPLIPNFKVIHTALSITADTKLEGDFEFKGNVYKNGEDVSSELTLDQTDFILYYQFLDTLVSFDVGLNFKYFQGELDINGTSANKSTSFSVVVPMAYGKGAIKIPATNFSVEADLSYISYDKYEFYDFKAYLAYEKKIGLITKIGAQVGYRTEKLNVEYDKRASDVEVGGPFGAIYLHF